MLATQPHQLGCRQRGKQVAEVAHQRLQIGYVVGPGDEDDDRELETSEFLLLRKMAVGSDEDVEEACGAAEKVAVLAPGPPYVADAANLMARKVGLEPMRKRLIKEYAH
jgi:hypothetical protein